MRSYNPEDEDDQKDVQEQHIEPWMLKLLKMNPAYTGWGVGEDYMSTHERTGWRQALSFPTWDDFSFQLDDLNELVNFHFEAWRPSKNCVDCTRIGYNPKTRRIHDTFYDFSKNGCSHEGWHDKITLDELQLLLEKGRCWPNHEEWVAFSQGLRPVLLATHELLDQVNRANGRQTRGSGLSHMHDAIDRHILTKARAQRLGVYGLCEKCNGEGSVYTSENAQVGVTFWFLHPRKGCSRGVEIKSLRQEELPNVFSYLRKAAARNAERFSRIPALTGDGETGT